MLRVAGMLRSNRSRPAALLGGFPLPRKSWKGKNVSAGRPRGVSWGGNGPGLRHKRAGSGRILSQRSNGGEVLVTPQKGGPPRKLVRLSDRPRACASKISDCPHQPVYRAETGRFWGFAGAGQNPSCRTGSLTGRQNLGFPLTEQHLRLEVCQSKQSRHSWGSLPSLGP